jgi:hypothetical protein
MNGPIRVTPRYDLAQDEGDHTTIKGGYGHRSDTSTILGTTAATTGGGILSSVYENRMLVMIIILVIIIIGLCAYVVFYKNDSHPIVQTPSNSTVAKTAPTSIVRKPETPPDLDSLLHRARANTTQPATANLKSDTEVTHMMEDRSAAIVPDAATNGAE